MIAMRLFPRCRCWAVVVVLLLAPGPSIYAQTAPWSGWVQCRFDVQGTGYSHQEIQTWTITGPPVQQSNVEVYPGTWTAIGTGMLRKMTDAVSETAQWTVMVPPMPAAFGITTQLDRLTVQRWTRQIVAAGGLTGQDVVAVTGSQPRTTNMILSVDEQPFATINVDLKATQANGSSTPVVSGLVGPIRPKDAQGKANCSWQFGRGGSLAPPPPSLTASSSAASTATVAQPTVTLGGAIAPTGTTAVMQPAPTTSSTTSTATTTTTTPTTTTSTMVATGILPLLTTAPMPRTITLTGFTAAGTAAGVAPRTIALTGFTAAGPAAAVAPRTIVLPGWTVAGP